jgi:bacillithiol synthase
MECHCLRLTELPHTTKLFADYLENFGRVAKWYGHSPDETGVVESAREIKLDSGMRREVVGILREQNQRFGADTAVMRNIDRLGEGAAAIVSGQQVGLFTGPAYSFYKAVSAVRWAEHLTSRGIDAVPIFWLATEDHDLAEINHCFWKGRTGITEFEMPGKGELSGRPVGEVLLGEEVGNVVETASGSLEGANSREIAEALRDSYRAGETFGSAFGKLLAKLLAGRGVILIDPLDARLHRLAKDVYRHAAEKAGELQEALLRRSKELDSDGYHVQVRVTRETTLLFSIVEGARQPLRNRNGKFSLGRQAFTRAELLAAIEERPELFSANVLLRPIVQDALLPTAAYLAGPAEVAYFAQAEVVYRELLGRMPAILPRPSFTLVEPQIARLLKKYQLTPSDALSGRQSLKSKLSLKTVPRTLASRFEKDEKTLRRLLKAYQKPLARVDKTLLGALETTERKMLYQFQKLRGKAGRAENFRTGVLDRHEKAILDSLYPHRALQERTLCLLPFLASFGPELLDRLTTHAGPSAKGHQVIFL